MAAILLTGCSDNEKDTASDSSKEIENSDALSKNEDKDEERVYQIGETAVITSDIYEFDYEVTVSDFNLTTEVDGDTIEEFVIGADETNRFAVVDVTIKNISEEEIIPNRQFSANLGGKEDLGGITSYNEYFPEGDEILEPGEEVKGHLVYSTTSDYSDTFILKYEISTDEETHFILPNPEL